MSEILLLRKWTNQGRTKLHHIGILSEFDNEGQPVVVVEGRLTHLVAELVSCAVECED